MATAATKSTREKKPTETYQEYTQSGIPVATKMFAAALLSVGLSETGSIKLRPYLVKLGRLIEEGQPHKEALNEALTAYDRLLIEEAP